MVKSAELREKRATLVNEARAVLKRAEDEARDTTQEEDNQYDKIMEEVDKLKDRIDRLEKLEETEGEMEEPADRSGRPATGEERARTTNANAAEVRSAFNAWARTGRAAPSLRGNQSLAAEFRDLQLGAIGTDTAGGYLVTPTQISDMVIKQCDDFTYIRKLAHIERVTEAKSLGVRQMTSRIDDFDWTTEITSVTQDTGQAFGIRDLTPNILTKLAKVSVRLLLASQDCSEIVTRELGYKFGLTQEKAFLTGSGSGEPLGAFTASASGIPTAQDVSSTGTATFIADDLFTVKYSIKQPYLMGPKCGWILHRTIVSMIRKFKDNYGQYLWAPGIAPGAPDRIIDVPYYMSEWAPNTMTTGDYVAVVGNWDYYWIAEVTGFILQRLVERYADTNEVGFLARGFIDGSPVLGEAFARLKLS